MKVIQDNFEILLLFCVISYFINQGLERNVASSKLSTRHIKDDEQFLNSMYFSNGRFLFLAFVDTNVNFTFLTIVTVQ